MIAHIRRLRSEEKGNATIEFAFLSVMFFAIIMAALDFGLYLTYRLRMGAAVEQASLLAFNNRANIDTTQLSNYIVAGSQLSSGTVTVDVKCNGTGTCVNTSRQCTCLSTDGKTYATAASCGATCGNGSTSGYYMKIAATYPYKAVVLPNKWLDGMTINQSSIVRLQ